MKSDTIISVRHLRKEFSEVIPLEDVNCDIKRGDVISIIGPSGTGKSTFLRCINKLETPTSGEILIDGENILAKNVDIYKIRQKMGMVFQNFNLFAHLTVIENIILGPIELLHIKKQEAYNEGIRLLKLVGLSERANNYPDELSGGQKQRVAIARTLAMKPEIILFDEPTSALDPTMVGEVLSVIRNLAKNGMTMLIVTHEMKFAHDVSTRVFYMDEGKIYEEGSPQQVFDNPEKEKTRAFVKRLKLFERNIFDTNFDFNKLNSELEEFCKSQGVSKTTIIHIQLLLEEIVQNAIIPKLNCSPKISFSLKYLETDDECELEFVHNCENFDLQEDNDNLSFNIITKIARSLEIEGNRITCKVD